MDKAYEAYEILKSLGWYDSALFMAIVPDPEQFDVINAALEHLGGIEGEIEANLATICREWLSIRQTRERIELAEAS